MYSLPRYSFFLPHLKKDTRERLFVESPRKLKYISPSTLHIIDILVCFNNRYQRDDISNITKAILR